MKSARSVLLPLLAGLLTFPQPALAFRSCFKPDPPYCIDAYGTFEDEWAFRSCRSDVEVYVSEVESYVDCLFRKAKAEAAEVQDEASQTIGRFNCKAQGGVIC